MALTAISRRVRAVGAASCGVLATSPYVPTASGWVSLLGATLTSRMDADRHTDLIDSPCVYDLKKNKPGIKPGAVESLNRRVGKSHPNREPCYLSQAITVMKRFWRMLYCKSLAKDPIRPQMATATQSRTARRPSPRTWSEFCPYWRVSYTS